jgi:hypothetical protein
MSNDGGRRGRFKIRGVYYPTYTSVRAEILRRLSAYAAAGGPKDFTPDDVDWFVHLIREMHPYASEKLSKPVVGIRKYNRYGHQADNLLLIYSDGSSDHFSWNKCCKGKKSSDGISIKAALRAAVSGQTLAASHQVFGGRETETCPACGKSMTRRLSHVDHMPPEFNDLIKAWLIDRGITLEQVLLADDPQGGAVMPAGAERDSWRSFHAREAKLIVTCVPCHQDRHARKKGSR